MGQFLALSAIIDVKEIDVPTALSGYAKAKSGVFEPLPLGQKTGDGLVVYSSGSRTSLLLPANLMDWWDLSQALSLLLKKSVLSLHIHDGDFWMYTLYRNGIQVDGFNPIPDYWGEKISDEQRQLYKGNADVVCESFPGVKPSDIEKYFIRWDLDSGETHKAYPEDKYPYGTDWQMLDFMDKLGLEYPLDSQGRSLGSTYRFFIPAPRSIARN